MRRAQGLNHRCGIRSLLHPAARPGEYVQQPHDDTPIETGSALLPRTGGCSSDPDGVVDCGGTQKAVLNLAHVSSGKDAALLVSSGRIIVQSQIVVTALKQSEDEQPQWVRCCRTFKLF